MVQILEVYIEFEGEKILHVSLSHEWVCGGRLLSVTLRHNDRGKTLPYMGIPPTSLLISLHALALHYMMPIYGDHLPCLLRQ